MLNALTDAIEFADNIIATLLEGCGAYNSTFHLSPLDAAFIRQIIAQTMQRNNAANCCLFTQHVFKFNNSDCSWARLQTFSMHSFVFSFFFLSVVSNHRIVNGHLSSLINRRGRRKTLLDFSFLFSVWIQFSNDRMLIGSNSWLNFTHLRCIFFLAFEDDSCRQKHSIILISKGKKKRRKVFMVYQKWCNGKVRKSLSLNYISLNLFLELFYFPQGLVMKIAISNRLKF